LRRSATEEKKRKIAGERDWEGKLKSVQGPVPSSGIENLKKEKG